MSMFRADKTTRENDDFKVLLSGLLVAIFLMVSISFGKRTYDQFAFSRPFIVATVKVVQQGNAEPYILYDADANQDVFGYWIASMIDAKGGQMVTRHGEGSYTDDVDDPRFWTWFAFFDNKKGLNSPRIPDVSFRVCVRYAVDARYSGIHDDTPNYCSNLFTPRS